MQMDDAAIGVDVAHRQAKRSATVTQLQGPVPDLRLGLGQPDRVPDLVERADHPLEERDLVRSYGHTYHAYRQRVSMLVPLPPRGEAPRTTPKRQRATIG